MKNKKLIVLAVSAIGLLGLTACGEVAAKATDYSTPLITVEGYENKIYNNEISVVYDKIREGNIGDDVLNELLYAYSITTFGYYNNYVSPAPAEGTITLEAAYKNIISNDADKSIAKAFIDAHKAYWTLDEDGNRVTDEEGEFARVQAKWESIEDRIAENLYSAISGSTYIDRNIFSEKAYLRGLLAGMEDVQDPDAVGFEGKLFEGILDPDIEARDVFIKTVGEEEKGFLHREYYQSEKLHYVERKIIPTIFRQLLNEQYLLDETYNTLGRSYARKVNIIKIADNTNYPKASDYLMKQLVSKISEEPDAATIKDSTKITLDTFKTYASLYVGSNLTDEQKNLIANTDLKDVFKNQGTYYTGTEYGDLMEQYNKIYTAPIGEGSIATIDATAESTFTDSGKYTKETGLELKTRELELKDYTTTGWYVKNGGLTELPDSIRSRLFNIGVANGVKETEAEQNAADRWQRKDDAWTYTIPEDESPYVARINGKNYLKTASSIDGSDNKNDILHYDSGSSAYYIIQIEEASSSSKLSQKSDHSYAELRGKNVMEEIVNEITKVVGTGESYSTLATKYFLEKMEIEYHDDVVYDYFNENYPELFEQSLNYKKILPTLRSWFYYIKRGI